VRGVYGRCDGRLPHRRKNQWFGCLATQLLRAATTTTPRRQLASRMRRTSRQLCDANFRFAWQRPRSQTVIATRRWGEVDHRHSWHRGRLFPALNCFCRHQPYRRRPRCETLTSASSVHSARHVLERVANSASLGSRHRGWPARGSHRGLTCRGYKVFMVHTASSAKPSKPCCAECSDRVLGTGLVAVYDVGRGSRVARPPLVPAVSEPRAGSEARMIGVPVRVS